MDRTYFNLAVAGFHLPAGHLLVIGRMRDESKGKPGAMAGVAAGSLT